ncbi:hypothetical protein [Marinitoga aeolica]|uniref:Uncharacterized protein n=1 Tax=Marinitoga aeolica TaxID=2809031 RepID=A0ABY8PSU0_9BACT|nr:hypothetical protein [Marinitoga aeolica]WGS65711.1 hypothetical protein JRV97_03930 [Marinitoga aeolica]
MLFSNIYIIPFYFIISILQLFTFRYSYISWFLAFFYLIYFLKLIKSKDLNKKIKNTIYDYIFFFFVLLFPLFGISNYIMKIVFVIPTIFYIFYTKLENFDFVNKIILSLLILYELFIVKVPNVVVIDNISFFKIFTPYIILDFSFLILLNDNMFKKNTFSEFFMLLLVPFLRIILLLWMKANSFSGSFEHWVLIFIYYYSYKILDSKKYLYSFSFLYIGYILLFI